jgi:hypothetical protein
MAKVKKGEYLSCEVCGLVVVVDEACGCAAAEILCCEKTMAKGKPAAKKKTPVKAAKAAGKTPVKAVAKKKTPVKAAKAEGKASVKAVAKAKPKAKK